MRSERRSDGSTNVGLKFRLSPVTVRKRMRGVPGVVPRVDSTTLAICVRFADDIVSRLHLRETALHSAATPCPRAYGLGTKCPVILWCDLRRTAPLAQQQPAPPRTRAYLT